MTTFDSTKASLNDLLREIREGKIQLPDFQRGWVWDDDHIRDLLVSIARSFPIGAVMLLESGGEVRFETRPVEGLDEKIPKDRTPEKLILDGQQRLTTLTQALSLDEPVRTTTAKGKKIKRHYYFDIRKAVETPHALDEAVKTVDENERLVLEFDEVEKTIEIELSKAESLRQSILKKAFSGQFVPQDPKDEPASRLLERIRAEKEEMPSPTRCTRKPTASRRLRRETRIGESASDEAIMIKAGIKE